MIVPMKKVCLVVQQKSHKDALLKLRKIGVLHIENTPAPESVAKAGEQKTKVENAIGLLKEMKPNKKKTVQSVPGIHKPRTPGGRRGRRAVDMHGTEEQEPYSLEAVRDADRPDLPDYIMNIGRERKNLEERILHLKKEISRMEPWGDFDPESVKELFSLNQPVYLYELTNEAFNMLDKEVVYIKESESKSGVRIIVFNKELPGIAPLSLPEKSITAMKNEIDEIKLELEELNAKLHNLTDRLPALNREMEAAVLNYEYDSALGVLENIEEIPEDMGLVYLTGYLPKPDTEKFKTAAAENGWGYSMADPAQDDDKVPTKLKNNKFVNLLNPITDFLGIVPGYNEVDISPWFLIFFCVFFGMIFGDAGYGFLLTIAAILGILKTAKKGVPVALQMLLLLGLVNSAWGIITCSWFGVESSLVPAFLQDISVPFFSTAKTSQDIVDKNLQFFCFAIGLVHMTIAHIKGFFRCKSLKALGEVGSIAMLWGMFNVILFLVVSEDYIIFPMDISIYLIAGGFFLSFVFASYEGSIGKSILDSFKNIISVILGITNVFSDIMSYIRLWAVGLAGASIAATVNTMAGPLLGNFLIFAGIILLVFGHGLNLILNVLSVLVHGVRLNTLEFSSHIGLTWSGTLYKPFAEKSNN